MSVSLLCPFLSLLSALGPGVRAQGETDVPFDPGAVVEHVRKAREDATPRSDTTVFLLDTNTLYAASGQSQSYPAVAFDGNCYLLVWTDHRCSFKDDIYGARITRDGVLLDSAGIPISLEPVNQARPSVAFDGETFLVVWSDTRTGDYDIHGARVSHDGEVLEPHGFVISSSDQYQQFPSVAAADTACLVVWQDARDGVTFDIYGARVVSGTVLDPAGLRISAAEENQQYPAVAGSEQGEWLVAWEDGRNGGKDVYAARLTTGGEVLDSTGIAVASGGHEELSAAVGFDSLWLVAWTDRRGGTYSDIYAARLGPSGVVLDSAGIEVSAASNSQYSPKVASYGSGFLLAWSDARSYPDYNIYGSRMTLSGTVLEPGGIAVAAQQGSQQMPAVAGADTNWFAAWTDGRGDNSWAIYGARVSPDGSVPDPDGIHASPLLYVQYEPDVAFDGSNYLVVWGDYRTGTNRDIYGCRVTPQGEVLDPAGIGLCTQGNWQGVAAAGFDGANYLVAWSDLRNTGDFDIYGARVSPDGEVLDPAGIAIARVDQIQIYPDIAWDGANWLVVYHDWRNHEYDIYGTRVASDGTVLDPNSIAISRADRNQYHPVVTSDGNKSFVVWDDTRSGSSRIYGTRVSQDGTVLDTNGVAVSTASSYLPAIGFDGGNYLVTWDDYRAGSADIYGARVAPDGTVLDPTGRPISTAANYQKASTVAFDGTDYVVAWEDWRGGHDYDVYAARVSTSGTVLETFPVQVGPQEHISPAVTHGPAAQLLLVWSGWTDSINQRVGNTQRIWGGLLRGPVGTAETAPPDIPSGQLVAWPSPFSRRTELRSMVPHDGASTIKVYQSGGSLVRTLTNDDVRAGQHSVVWDGRDDTGEALPNGVYLVRLSVERADVATGVLILAR